MQENTPSKDEKEKPKRGRPKSSPLSQAELTKLRVQRLRERKRGLEGLVRVDTWVPETLKDVFVSNGEDLAKIGAEAFELLARKRGYLKESEQ